MSEDPRWLYRQMIDAMVVSCAQGQGQISAQRVRVGVWNDNADEIADVINEVSAAMSPEELVAMNVESSVDQRNTEDIAKDWIAANL